MLELLTKIQRRQAYLKKYSVSQQRQTYANKQNRGPIWTPQVGPQERAYNSDADIIGYGGAAGGGKSSLALGFAATRHRRSIIFRQVFPSLRGLIEDSRGLLCRPNDNFNESLHIWRTADDRLIEFGSVQYQKDKKKHQGQPRDLIVFDEATEFPETTVRFLIGWNRSSRRDQKCRVLLTFNPPMDDAGDWVTRYFAPWLDPNHPQPANDGDLRWFAMVEGEEKEVSEGNFGWYVMDGLDLRPATAGDQSQVPMRGVEINGKPYLVKSRTFFHAQLKDNPILAATGYGATIDAMPEPLRSLLKGNFEGGRQVDPWQVIPGDWVRIAQDRWKKMSKPADLPCTTLGVDVARGGQDKTVISKRYGNWFAELLKYPGKATTDGPSVAALVMQHHEKRSEDDKGPKVHIDAIGVGTSPFDILKNNNIETVPVIASEGSDQLDKLKKLKFRNLRAEMYWRFREALDPANGEEIALPPDPELLADLCAPKWSLTVSGILIESKADIIERIGRSPDCADAVVMAAWLGPKPKTIQAKVY